MKKMFTIRPGLCIKYIKPHVSKGGNKILINLF